MKRLIYIPIAAILALYLMEMSADPVQFAHEAVRGEELAPYQYRPLFAYLFVGLDRLIGQTPALWLFWFLSFALFAPLTDEWLGKWMGGDRAFTWTLVSLFIVLGSTWFVPAGLMWSLLETIFWLIALLLLHSGRVLWMARLVFVATLNRETTVLLPLLAWLSTGRWRLATGLLAIWTATYGGLRLYYGDVPLHLTLGEIWHANTVEYVGSFLLGLALFGWIPVLALRGYRTAPPFVKRGAWVAIPYLAAIAVFGIWREFRLFLPLLPLAIPLVMNRLGENGAKLEAA
jgi:hypothetical protein